VLGFRDGRALMMPMGSLEGITLGDRADFEDRPAMIHPSFTWLGRMVDDFGKAMHGQESAAAEPCRLSSESRMGGKLDLGVRALKQFATCYKGQRMGIIAGFGVGKSTRRPCWRATPMPTPS
jgi:flagellum-specific ATP synthase